MSDRVREDLQSLSHQSQNSHLFLVPARKVKFRITINIQVTWHFHLRTGPRITCDVGSLRISFL